MAESERQAVRVVAIALPTLRQRRSASNVKGIAPRCLPQPPLGVLIAWTHSRNELPELRRVIHAAQVHQLVDQDIVADPIGREDQAPVQRDPAARRTRSPARTLIAY